MPQSPSDLDQICVNTIRMLAVDMVQAANSGHPGMPLGAAPMAYVLWTKVMRHNPADPAWPGRDRFLLSAGHGSALLYALLHTCGYNLPMDELKNFRQWQSRTPGHPELGLTAGVEATAGPLGQGFAMGVGMAMAQRYLAGLYHRPGYPVMDHHVYAIVSDGDLMEGVSSEAASLAGTLGLGRLIYLYDDNHICIEGDTELTFTEDVAERFEAYHWQVLTVDDGNDLVAIENALTEARADSTRPSLIKVRTHIGFGSPMQDDAGAHGAPLGAEGIAATRKFFSWPDEDFHLPDKVAKEMAKVAQRGQQFQAQWKNLMVGFSSRHSLAHAELSRQLRGEFPPDWEKALPLFEPEQGPMATRAASGKVLNALASELPCLVGGSADLAPSNKTMIAGSGDLRQGGAQVGRNVHFGVREHAMAAAVNGMALHGGISPYGGTFFVFSDYMRPALRMAALMELRSTFIFTHDSLAVGEDGPTHQPVEHLMSLRAMPGLTLIRPADANETTAAWRQALLHPGPVCLLLSRQKLPVLDARMHPIADGAAKGAYVLDQSGSGPEVIIMASGAEVHLALGAMKELGSEGIGCRVVSMPSWELFAAQDQAYRDTVLPPEVKARLSVEAGVTLGWERYVGDAGAAIGVDRFGASAPGAEVLANYGFTVENVVAKAKALLK